MLACRLAVFAHSGMGGWKGTGNASDQTGARREGCGNAEFPNGSVVPSAPLLIASGCHPSRFFLFGIQHGRRVRGENRRNKGNGTGRHDHLHGDPSGFAGRPWDALPVSGSRTANTSDGLPARMQRLPPAIFISHSETIQYSTHKSAFYRFFILIPPSF